MNYTTLQGYSLPVKYRHISMRGNFFTGSNV